MCDASTNVKEYVKVRKEYGENSAEAKALEKKLADLTSEQKDAGKAADAEEKEISDVTKSLGLYEKGTKSAAAETEKSGNAFSKVADTLKTVSTILA